MKKILIFLIFIIVNLSAQSKVDCLILKDENSIICKYTHKRIAQDHNVRFDWIEPNGIISRSRIMNIPAGHGSVYDYRFISGRTKGTWTFKVTDDNNTYETNFEIK